MWRAPFVLQTFAHHFNFIQGYVDLPDVMAEPDGARGALALACAAVSHALSSFASHSRIILNVSFLGSSCFNIGCQ